MRPAPDRMQIVASLALALSLAQAAPAPPEPLASLPVLKEPVPVTLPAGTVFPRPEVTVILALEVGADGKVEKASVEQGAGEPFDGAAVAAASRLSFEPARLATGEAVPVSLSFALRIVEPPRPAPPPPPPARLQGTLLQRGTRRPLADVPVAARSGEETLARASTDAAGRFALEVAGGGFQLVAVAPGHERLDLPVLLAAGEQRDEIFYLQAEPSDTVAVVRGERIRREITRQVIPSDEVALVAGSQGDTLKAVLNLPGVARQSFLGGELVLRGSSPGDSAVFLEGVQIPAIYHFGGIRSTFAPRFLDSLEFVPGNVAPDYGRLTGGIVNVKVRDAAPDLVRGELDLNLYDGGGAVEGPLSEHWTGGAAFRRSWVGDLLPLFLPKDAPLSFSSAPAFYDYQFLATWTPGERERVRLLWFGSQDKLVALLTRPAGDPTISGNLQTRLAFHSLQAAWSRTISPALRQESALTVGLQDLTFELGPQLFFKLGSQRLDGRSSWTWRALPALEVRGGVDLQYARYDISLDLPQPPQEGQPNTPVSTRPRVVASQRGDQIDPAAFAELRISPRDGLAVLPSVRVDWNSSIGRWSLDPRLGTRWQVAPGTVLKAAAGLYQQPPDPAQSARDIGTPDLLPKRSLQISAGVEWRIAEGIDLDSGPFYKALSRLVVQNPAAQVDPAAPRYLNDGTGRVYGLELLLRARFGDRFFGWVAYTFQRSLRTDHPGQAERRFDYDQPHILTALGSWKLSPLWTLGARFRLVSGNPETPVTGSVYDAATDVHVPVYGPVNSARLTAFHALDLRAERTWTYDRWRLSAYLDVQNVYNHASQEGWQYSFDFRRRAPLTGLPILPIAGIKAEW